MKKYRKQIACLLAAAVVIGMTPIPRAQAATVKLNKTKLTLTVGNTAKLKLKNTKKKVTWSSSKKSVATVSKSGTVRAKKKGTATITAKAGKKKYKCKVTCRAKQTPTPKPNTNTSATGSVPVNSIVMNTPKITIEVGETSRLGITISPGNATSKSVKWDSFYPGIASVDKNGVVTGVSRGKAVILVEKDDKYGCAHDYCEVTVVTPKPSATPIPTLSPMVTRTPAPSMSPSPTPSRSPSPSASPTVRPSTSPTPTPDTSVTKAPLVDSAAPTIPEANLIKNYQVKAVKGTEIGNIKMVNVTITGNDLAEHANASGTRGHWVGIGIPKGGSYLQGRGNYPAITSLGGQTYDSKPAGEINANSVTFYFDVRHAGTDNGYVVVKNGTGTSETYTIYIVNFTNVTWKNGTASPASSANPSASPSANPSSSPSARPSSSPSSSPSTNPSSGPSASPGTSTSPSPSPTPANDPTVVKAPLVDHTTASPIPSADLIKDYKVTAVKGEETNNVRIVNVTITGKDLYRHETPGHQKGHWVGIGIPEMKGNGGYVQGRGSAPAVADLATQKYSTSTDGVMGPGIVSFYFDAQRLGNDTGYVIVKNDVNGTTEYIIYNVDFSDVPWIEEPAPTAVPVSVSALGLNDIASNNTSDLISDYRVSTTLDEKSSTGRMLVVNVKITGSNLKSYQNKKGTNGHWVGISVDSGPLGCEKRDGAPIKTLPEGTTLSGSADVPPASPSASPAAPEGFWFDVKNGGTNTSTVIIGGQTAVGMDRYQISTYIVYNVDYSGVTLAN